MLRCPMSIIPPTDDDSRDERGVPWREPRGFESYQVSYLGEVKSFVDARHPNGRLLNAPTGRTLVYNDDGKRTTKSLAHLVMLAWHAPRPGPGHSVGRLTDDLSDNRAVNLFWESRHEMNLRSNRPKRDACPRGHLYQGDNLFINREGCRCCRTCSRAHWWASKFRREARVHPFDGRLSAPITVEVILSMTPDGRFTDGAPDLSEVLVQAARHHHQVTREAERVARSRT